MGNSEEEKPCKPESPASPPMELQDQKGVQVYPNWAMMQGYYGPRFAVPPYLNSAAGSSHSPPPYMWVPPQSMMPPYGIPYPAFYAHGGVYGHPGAPTAGTAFSAEISVQSSGQTDGGSNKKLKEVDGLAISVGNGNADSGEHETDHRLLESEETDDSSDGSNGVTAEAGEGGMKRSRPGSPNSAAEDVKAKKKGNSIPSTHNETWLLNERDLKRERRKQSNRESARRSRLRKQAEAEQLTTKVQKIINENTTLKSKINEFMELSKKLKLENVKLMERLNDARSEDLNSKKMNDCTANLLERVNENDHKSRANRLHQLLDAIANPMADAVAAS